MYNVRSIQNVLVYITLMKINGGYMVIDATYRVNWEEGIRSE